MRLNRRNEVLMPDILPSGLRDIPEGDESEITEQMTRLAQVDIEEIGLHQIRGSLPLSIARDAMDPADVMPRNMRIVPRRSKN